MLKNLLAATVVMTLMSGAGFAQFRFRSVRHPFERLTARGVPSLRNSGLAAVSLTITEARPTRPLLSRARRSIRCVPAGMPVAVI